MMRKHRIGDTYCVRVSYLPQGEVASFYICQAKIQHHGTISMMTLTHYVAPVRAGYSDRRAVSIPTYPEISVNGS